MGCRKGSQLPTLVQNANVGKFDAMVDNLVDNVLDVGLQSPVIMINIDKG
jgi:hypothetical protein